jgi:hypothetical protein
MFRWRRRSGSAEGPAPGSPPAEDLRCSFCNKPQNDVLKLIAGPTVFICDECVSVCVDIIADDSRFEGRPGGASRGERTREAQRPLAQDAVPCSLCGKPSLPNEMLPIADRGVLCGGCADAVEDALARGTPEPPTLN